MTNIYVKTNIIINCFPVLADTHSQHIHGIITSKSCNTYNP